MRDLTRKVGAVSFGFLLVAALALGGAFAVNPNVNTLDQASDQYVQKSEGVALLVAGAVGFAVGATAYHAFVGSHPDVTALEGADAAETKAAIYDQGSIQQANVDQTMTTYGNYLNDTQSVALMEGKNAYITALENGSAESVARNRATNAVADYYAVKQQNVIASWNTTVTVWNSSRHAAANTTDVSKSFATFFHSDGEGNYSASDHLIRYEGHGTSTVTLANASTETVESLEFKLKADGNSYSGDQWVTPTNVPSHNPHGKRVETHGLRIKAPNQNFDDLDMVTWDEYQSTWQEIESQNTEVQAQMDTFIDNTYSSYQQGDINTTDLIDPYLGAREYSPETSDTWNLRTLSSIGLNGPQNLSTIGVMNVTTDGRTLEGVLMSHETPAGGFVVGDTYNTTQLNGSQFVAETNGGTQKLEGEFVIDSAETTDGETYAAGDSIEYRDISYSTADTEEFKALQSQLDELTAQIEARQDSLRNSGGGFLDGIGLGGVSPVVLLALAGGALLAARTN